MEGLAITTEQSVLSRREIVVYMIMMLVIYWWARFRVEIAIEFVTLVVLHFLEFWVTEVL